MGGSGQRMHFVGKKRIFVGKENCTMPMAPAAAAATAAGTSHGVTMLGAKAGPNPRSVPGSLVGGRACSRADVPGTARPRGWLPERAGRRETARRGSARAGDGGLNSPPPMAPPTPARPANLSGTRGKWGGGWAARGRRCVCTDGKDFITGTLRAYIASVVYQGYGHQARSEAQQALYSAAAGGGLACEALGPRLAGVAVIGGGALPVEVVGVHLLLPPARHTQNRISQ